MGNAQSCVVCTNGAPDVLLGRWGIGLTFSAHADTMGGVEPAIYYPEDSLSGWYCDSTYIENGKIVLIIEVRNDIAVIETIALARAFWSVAKLVRPPIVPVIVSDRVASLRDLERSNGRQISTEQSSSYKTYRYASAHSLRLLRAEIVRALRVHDTIRAFYHKE